MHKIKQSGFFGLLVVCIVMILWFVTAGVHTSLHPYLKGLVLLLLLGAFFFSAGFWFKTVQRKAEVILVVVIVVVMLLGLEVVLRFTACGQEIETFPDDVHFKLKPNAVHCNRILDGVTFHVTSNTDGFPDSEFPISPDTKKVYLLGDSMVACLQANYSACMHTKLEEGLQDTYGNIDVLNFGTGGYGTHDSLAIVKKYDDIYNPDMIILVFLPSNDLGDIERYRNYDYNSVKRARTIDFFMPRVVSFFVGNTKNILARLSPSLRLRFSYKNTNLENYEIYRTDYDAKREELWQAHFQALRELKSIAGQREIPFIVVIAPGPEQSHSQVWDRLVQTYPSLGLNSYDLEKPNRILTSFAANESIDIIDLLPTIRNSNPEELYYPFDGHWTDKGQLLATDVLLKHIKEQYPVFEKNGTIV